MNRDRLAVIAFVLLPVVIGLATAQTSTPQLIKLQGFLSQNNGGNVTPVNGPATMTFSLYDADPGGALVASVGPTIVDVVNGLYEVDLPFAPSSFVGSSRFIELNVGGQVLAPRLQLSTAPFAYVADTLDGLDAADFAKPADVSAALASHVAAVDPHTVYVKKTGDFLSGTLSVNVGSGPALVALSGNVG